MRESKHAECSNCLNSELNPLVRVSECGLCQQCQWFSERFSVHTLRREFSWFTKYCRLQSQLGNAVALGFSGGKDSTSVALQLIEMGIHFRCVTFNTGYYPKHIVERSAAYAGMLGLEHMVFDVRSLITPEIRRMFAVTSDFFADFASGTGNKEDRQGKFARAYITARQHYSARDLTILPYVRPCQLCRKVTIRAYTKFAESVGCNVLILGMNEWAHLSSNGPVSGIRQLKGERGWPLYVVHLPFIMSRQLDQVEELLRSIAWRPPHGEQLVETNGNSCLLAAASENIFRRELGFHPDTSRISREICAGFLPRSVGQNALRRVQQRLPLSMRNLLTEAGILPDGVQRVMFEPRLEWSLVGRGEQA